MRENCIQTAKEICIQTAKRSLQLRFKYDVVFDYKSFICMPR
jgi:hypothetical protein